ncbi:MAG: hemolysin family protein [Bacillaceae bacterium]
MDQIPVSTIATLFVFIILSAFFSSAETAFSSVNRIRLKNYVDENRRGSQKALYIVENFDKALSTILIGNNVVNIAASAIATQLATDLLKGANAIVISTTVMTIIVLIFGEVLPKSFAKENAEGFALTVSGPLLLLMKILTPFNYLLVKLKTFVSRFVGKKNNEPSVTEEELKVMVDLSEEEGVINKEEKELVHRSLDFNDILVGEILQPRIDMVAVEVNDSIEKIRDIFIEERYSRIPVYEENVDNVIGILSDKEFFTYLIQNKAVDLRELLRKPLFIVESMKISTLLPQLQKSKSHMAIVIDEFGGTSGLVTLEDILEEIVGDIWDEHDERVKNIVKVDESTYQFNAELPLDEFTEIFADLEVQSDFHTLGGWIFERFERIPLVGEKITYDNLEIRVDKVENRRIRKVTVTTIDGDKEVD